VKNNTINASYSFAYPENQAQRPFGRPAKTTCGIKKSSLNVMQVV
jgi:hypothetical protein